MSASEKLSIVGDVRKALQDFLAPELREVRAELKSLSDSQRSLADGQKAILDSQRDMEARLVREIKNTEEKLLIRIELAESNMRLEQAMRTAETALRENEQLKREKTQ